MCQCAYMLMPATRTSSSSSFFYSSYTFISPGEYFLGLDKRFQIQNGIYCTGILFLNLILDHSRNENKILVRKLKVLLLVEIFEFLMFNSTFFSAVIFYAN